jgi:hypothetical protein
MNLVVTKIFNILPLYRYIMTMLAPSWTPDVDLVPEKYRHAPRHSSHHTPSTGRIDTEVHPDDTCYRTFEDNDHRRIIKGFVHHPPPSSFYVHANFAHNDPRLQCLHDHPTQTMHRQTHGRGNDARPPPLPRYTDRNLRLTDQEMQLLEKNMRLSGQERRSLESAASEAENWWNREVADEHRVPSRERRVQRPRRSPPSGHIVLGAHQPSTHAVHVSGNPNDVIEAFDFAHNTPDFTPTGMMYTTNGLLVTRNPPLPIYVKPLENRQRY